MRYCLYLGFCYCGLGRTAGICLKYQRPLQKAKIRMEDVEEGEVVSIQVCEAAFCIVSFLGAPIYKASELRGQRQ